MLANYRSEKTRDLLFEIGRVLHYAHTLPVPPSTAAATARAEEAEYAETEAADGRADDEGDAAQEDERRRDAELLVHAAEQAAEHDEQTALAFAST